MAWSDTKEELLKKVNQEMDEYARSMWDLPGYAVYGKADEIAAMKSCYNQLIGELEDYPAEHLEYLLRFKTPLKVLCVTWMDAQNCDLSEEFRHMLWNLWDKGDAELDYELDVGWQQGGPSMC